MPGSRLTALDRVVIERAVEQGLSVGVIAGLIGKHRTTVVREIKNRSGRSARHSVKVVPLGHPRVGRPPVYRARAAQGRADRLARRPKPHKLVGPLAVVVSGLLGADWSPQQIAAMLPRMFPDDHGMRVSHETIYQSLFVQTRGQLRRELAAHLRSGRKNRKPRGPTSTRGRLTGTTPISSRPAEADDRAVPGHWEGDLLLGGQGKGAVITLVERKTRFVLLAPLPDSHKAIDLRAVLTPMIASLPDQLRKTLTWDQGKEMARHAEIAIDAAIDLYFCDPHSPWQRGTNENTNGLLRQYWPKGADLRNLTQADCDQIAFNLNNRPRQTLGWKTPREAYEIAVSATAV